MNCNFSIYEGNFLENKWLENKIQSRTNEYTDNT